MSRRRPGFYLFVVLIDSMFSVEAIFFNEMDDSHYLPCGMWRTPILCPPLCQSFPGHGDPVGRF